MTLMTLSGCSGDRVLLLPSDPEPPSRDRYAEGRVPLPGCERFEYTHCDIHDPACLLELANIAACLRGDDTAGRAPVVSFWSEADVEAELVRRFDRTPRADPDHFEVALTRFGLTQPDALDSASRAALSAQRWAALYDYERQEIIVVDHAEPLDAFNQDVLMLHELVHALQDRDHDLEAFVDAYGQGSDGDLRAQSVIEGEARLHEQRYLAALSGLDIAELDLERTFDNLHEASENWLFEQPDLYSASRSSAPYAHGAEYVFHVWSSGGEPAVRALFDAPPDTMHDILSSAWGGAIDIEVEAVNDTLPPDPPEARLAAWTTMGAWGVYLLARPRLPDAEAHARELALAWRGDRLEAFSFGAEQTAARWQIQFVDADAAASFEVEFADDSLITATRDGSRVVLIPR